MAADVPSCPTKGCPKSLQAPVLATLALPASLLCIVPLVCQLKSRNLSAIILVAGVMILNFFNFVNAIIWHTSNAAEWWDGRVLCDVEIKLYVGLPAAGIGAVCCIFRQLAIILDTERATLQPSLTRRRRQLAVELALCFVFPAYLMIASFLFQPNRYNIITAVGCAGPIDISWVSISVLLLWTPLLCILATIYCCLAGYRLLRHRRQLESALQSTGTRMNSSRYKRLYFLCAVLVVAYFPLYIFVFQQYFHVDRAAFSWSRIHSSGWSSDIRRFGTQGQPFFDRWIQVGTGYLIFSFFGLGHDAAMLYRGWLLKLGIARLFPGLQHNPLVGPLRSSGSGHTPVLHQTLPSQTSSEPRTLNS